MAVGAKMVSERRGRPPMGADRDGCARYGAGVCGLPVPVKVVFREEAANKGGTTRHSRRPFIPIVLYLGGKDFFFSNPTKPLPLPPHPFLPFGIRHPILPKGISTVNQQPSSTPLITIRGLSKTFSTPDGDFTALRDIDLTIRRGEIFGIIGLSGAGKSTLVRCINFLERPTTGSVTVDGKDLSTLSRAELLAIRRDMGMIFQSFNLLAQRTALGNILFPLEIAKMPRAKAKKRAIELLELVGLADKADSYPSQLSGGQKQRVAIARALASDPKVLLCDEATSALDPTTTASILELLAKINRELGVTVIIITHEMKVIESICHRVAVIDHSRIAEMGEVREVFIRPKSAIARELIFPTASAARAEDGMPAPKMGSRLLRLIFDGTIADEPILANLILECRAPVTILGADTKAVGGKAIGQMLLRLPEDELAVERICAYLTDHGIPYTEEASV